MVCSTYLCVFVLINSLSLPGQERELLSEIACKDFLTVTQRNRTQRLSLSHSSKETRPAITITTTLKKKKQTPQQQASYPQTRTRRQDNKINRTRTRKLSLLWSRSPTEPRSKSLSSRSSQLYTYFVPPNSFSASAEKIFLQRNRMQRLSERLLNNNLPITKQETRSQNNKKQNKTRTLSLLSKSLNPRNPAAKP